MLTHIGMLTLQESATQADRQAIADGLMGLVGQIDGLQRVEVGVDLGLKDGTADVLFRLEFATEDAWRAYAAHPAHQAVITERIAPVLASKLFVQVGEFQESRA